MITAKGLVQQYSRIGLKKLAVPEWQEKGQEMPFVYYKDFTLLESEEIDRKCALDDSISNKVIQCLILKCLDCDGQNIFTAEDKTDLLQASSKGLSRVALEIFRSASFSEDDFKDSKKN